MSTTYAADTSVPASRSREEVARLLVRYGVSDFATGVVGDDAVVAFVMRQRHVKITVPMTRREEFKDYRARNGRVVSGEREYEQATRSRWRSLVLILKAKLEAVASGVVTFEQEFGMHLVLPDGRTVAEHVVPEIRWAYENNQAPPMLGGSVGRPQIGQ